MSQYDTMGAFRPPGGPRSSRVLAWGVVGGFAALLVAGLVWADYVQRHGTRYDPSTLCDTRGPSAITVLLVDATDPISALQRQAINNRLDRLLSKLRTNERLDVYEIRGDRNLLAPVFSECRPLSPDEVSEATGNRRLAEQRFDVDFKQRLATTLDSLISQPPSNRSPIMEAIQAADVRSFQSPSLRTRAPGFRRRLIVVSDMLENGAAGSHYGAEPDFGHYRRTPEFTRFSSDLTDVGVVILYLRRVAGEGVQGTAHIDFWNRWFSAQGASLDRAIPIEG